MIEYRVKSVERFIVTRYEQADGVDIRPGAVTYVDPDSPTFKPVATIRQIGPEFDSIKAAYEVGHAMAFQDRERLGLPPGDMGVIFPSESLEAARG